MPAMSSSCQTPTIAAIATAPGRGGVAVVRVSGPAAFRIAEQVTGRPVGAHLAGRFFHAAFRDPAAPARPAFDEGLLLVFAAPRSYTGEDVVELQGHGGSVAPRRVLEACLAAGARLARRGEFTERAFLNGRLDLGAAEAVLDLIDARTERAADDAAARLGGAASRALNALYDQALALSSQVEHALDFSEEELPDDFSGDVQAAVARLLAAVDGKLSTAREGRLLRDGARVVLAGAPNAGKSSLMNALLGERRVLVSDAAGTTRDAVEEALDVRGWPVRLVDTAGLRATEDAVEAEGVARAEALIAQADVVLRLVPPDASPCPDAAAANEILVFSKCDLAPAPAPSPLRVSAKTGEGLDALKDALADRLARLAARSAEETGADVTTRQKDCLQTARAALVRAQAALRLPEWTIAANELRAAAEALGQILGKVYSDDLLDALFSRFCIGK